MRKRPPLPETGWTNIQSTPPTRFKCGFCEESVASEKGWDANKVRDIFLRVCPLCHRPTYWEGAIQSPGTIFGAAVKELPTEIEAIYNEARECCSVDAFTAAVLLLRKLLMNVAVNLKAAEGKPFISYVEYLADKGYVPPNGKGWVDHIRKKGNEANHEIALMTKADAEELIIFSEMLLKFIYEFPKRVPQTPAAP